MKRKSTITEFKTGEPGAQVYQNKELLAKLTNKDIDSRGNAYVSRDYAGCDIVVLVLRPNTGAK